MRVSSNSDDPGFDNWTKLRMEGKDVRVLLDGVEMKFCSMADEELGLLTCCVLDNNGEVQVDPSDANSIWIEERQGRVELVIENVQ